MNKNIIIFHKLKNYIFIILIIKLLINILIYNFNSIKPINKYISKEEFINLDYNKNKFAIIRRSDCPPCGLFSYFIVYLGCINQYINLGYIPIIDLMSFPNIFNKLKVKLEEDNPWEFFFFQPLGYTLKEVIHKGKNIKFFECYSNVTRPDSSIFSNNILLDFWNKISKLYIPIKNEILNEAQAIIKKLFNNSQNILGILIRGTDYITIKPSGHPIQPTPIMVINDIKEFDKKYDYDFFFLSTEDDGIREIFIKEFKNKLKFLKYKYIINYNYKNKDFLGNNENILGNIEFNKIYILNIIILSKCIDLISGNTSGTIGIYVLTNGFRYSKVYDLGNY